MQLPGRAGVVLLIASVLTVAGAGWAHGSPIAITNAGFEALALMDGAFSRPDIGPNPVIPGWTVTGLGAGTPDGGTFDPTLAHFPGDVPEGENVAYSSSLLGSGFTIAVISQILADTLEADTLYTLQVDVGDRLDTGFGGYLIELLAGSTVLAFDSSSLTPPDGGFVTSTTLFFSGASSALLGQPLQIRMRLLNSLPFPQVSQVNFDNVRLDGTRVDAAVPEPATLLLLGAGLAAAGVRARRRSRVAGPRTEP